MSERQQITASAYAAASKLTELPELVRGITSASE
jgi:hypothetical protein